MVSGGMSCIKYLLFAFNLVFVIFGILLLYSGFSTVTKIGHYQALIEDAPNNVAITLIIVGFVIFFIAFLGCCGAIRESSCMLITFSAIILGILLIELIGAGLVLTFKSKLKDVAKEGIEKAIQKYETNSTIDSPLTKVLDDIQSHLHCCGALQPSDWNENKHFNGTDNYPYSCCPQEVVHNTTACTTATKDLYKRGCVDALDEEIRYSFGLLGGIAIAIAVIQLLGIIFACSLSRTISKEYEVV